MKQLPQARATGNIHIGTMTGKLNGVIPATTPKRLPQRVAVDPRADILGHLALEQLGRPGGELDHLDAAGDLAQGIGIDLAVLGGDRLGDAALVVLEQPQEPVEDPRPAQRRGHRPGWERSARGLDRFVHFRSTR